MFPSLAIMGFGERRILVPFPVVLLWPVIAIACLGFALAGSVRSQGKRSAGFLPRLKMAFSVFYHLSGLRVDVRSRDGGGFYLRLI